MLFSIVMIIGIAYAILILFLPIIIGYQWKKIWRLEEKLEKQWEIIELLSNDKYKENDKRLRTSKITEERKKYIDDFFNNLPMKEFDELLEKNGIDEVESKEKEK